MCAQTNENVRQRSRHAFEVLCVIMLASKMFLIYRLILGNCYFTLDVKNFKLIRILYLKQDQIYLHCYYRGETLYTKFLDTVTTELIWLKFELEID